jgi:hypothetical protein
VWSGGLNGSKTFKPIQKVLSNFKPFKLGLTQKGHSQAQKIGNKILLGRVCRKEQLSL